MQSAAAANDRVSEVLASDRVRAEWRNRIAAEYGSAAITQNFVLWLIQIGASPDLIEDGLVIVRDELAHSGLSAEVYTDAGGTEPPAIDRATLGLTRRPGVPLEHDVLRSAVQIFCLNETVAVPLFSRLRSTTTVPSARAALDRVLRDEVRHRDFGWACLDWFLVTPMADEVPALVLADLPTLFDLLEQNYGSAGTTDDGGITDEDRAWGLAPPREYAEILAETHERDYRPRFAARGVIYPPR